jgi:hypothetical protein
MSVDRYTGTNCIRTYPLKYTTSTLRFTEKDNNECERQLYSNYWREQLDLYGQKVKYYRNSYNLLSADNVYGEQPTSRFEDPKDVVMAIQLSENALILSKFGYMSDETCTAYMHISSFYATFPPDAEPKAGDVFKLAEYGNSRPGDRDGKMYEITERLDQENSQINPLMGHYVWLLKAKRFDYSFEPNLPQEKGSNQVYDNERYGTITTNLPNDVTYSPRPSSYPESSDKFSSKNIFDMSVNNTEIYGGYY